MLEFLVHPHQIVDSQSEILKVCHKKVTEGDIHLMERDYEYSIEDFLSICPQPISL